MILSNLEYKVRVEDLETAERAVAALGARYLGTHVQEDTYFCSERGRLKLREEDGQRSGTLIYYERANEATSRESSYVLVPVDDAGLLKRALAAALGARTVVRKVRGLYLYGHTRIHLDEVDRLGRFVELETVLSDQPDGKAAAEHEHVKAALGLHDNESVNYEPVAVSYAELQLERAAIER